MKSIIQLEFKKVKASHVKWGKIRRVGKASRLFGLSRYFEKKP